MFVSKIRRWALVALLIGLLPVVASARTPVGIAPLPERSVAAAPSRAVAGPSMPRGSLAKRPWMVMIDNHPDSYPQSGLDKAAVVFEGLAEYGITRYIATYADGWTPDASQIGPVRSTRVYFAQWAMGFHPVYVHAGGSPDGLKLVQTTNQLVDFEALNQPKYTYRDAKRRAPQNLYTNSALLRAFATDKKVSAFSDASVGYTYAAAAPLAKPQVTAINYYFQDKGSAAGFAYNAAQNVYYRTRLGRAHIDRITGAQLWTNNVVIMQVTSTKRAGDDKSRIDQNVIGTGAARFFLDGRSVNGSWSKPSEAAPLRFFDSAGKEIVFSKGSTWIAAIPAFDRLTAK